MSLANIEDLNNYSITELTTYQKLMGCTCPSSVMVLYFPVSEN